MITIGVLSDTHIQTRRKTLPKEMLAVFDEVDMIIHAGDLVTLDVVSDLQLYAPTYAVAGNMDNSGIHQHLPMKRVVEAGDRRIGITHGAGSPFDIKKRILNLFKEDKVDCIVYGHTHQAKSEIIDGVLLFNPGSAGESSGSYGLIFVQEGKELETKIIHL